MRKRSFASSGILVEDGPVDTIVKLGMAGEPACTELEVLLAVADRAYQTKGSGRNCVDTVEELPLRHWRSDS